MSKFTTMGQREVFLNALALLQQNNYSLERAKLTQSFLRSEVLMSTSSSKLHLPVLVTDNINGNAFNTERRLQLTDVFIVSALRILVAKPGSATDSAYDVYTYSNLTAFSTSGTAAAIRGAFANGYLNMLVDNDQVLPAWEMNWHYLAPRTQQATNTGYTSSAVNLLDSRDGSNDGIVQVEPNFILSGNSQIEFNMNLISAMAAVETASRWIVIMSGVLAQNVSKIAN